MRGKGLTINKDNFDSKDLSTSGQCPKAWYRTKDNYIELYKDGNNSEVLNEVLAVNCIDDIIDKYIDVFDDLRKSIIKI